MGQAKLRAKEIEQLKAQQTTVTFLAIRHTRIGKPEFVSAQITLGNPYNNKNDLLAFICLKDWLHTPPVSAIAEYLLQTKSYQMISKMQDGMGYVLNFHELDKEFTQLNGKASHSCRDIMAMPVSDLEEYAKDLAKSLKEDTSYSVKQH